MLHGRHCLQFTSEKSDEEVDLFDIHSLWEAYKEAISNNDMIASAYKTMKRNYKNACKLN